MIHAQAPDTNRPCYDDGGFCPAGSSCPRASLAPEVPADELDCLVLAEVAGDFRIVLGFVYLGYGEGSRARDGVSELLTCRADFGQGFPH